MGILNVTPDSVSDGGTATAVDAALARATSMDGEGAAIIDVGGESTRPGAVAVPVDVEIDRVVPVIEAISADPALQSIRISVDTRNAEVARAAVAAGASIINDVGATLWPVAAELGVGWVGVHMAGEPATMQDAPAYVEVVAEVFGFLTGVAAQASAAGVPEMWIDPGIGFGKTHDHNLSLLAAIGRFAETGIPVAVGTSRKATMGRLNARADAAAPGLATLVQTPTDDRLEASIATATWAMWSGVSLVRVHDVRPHVRAAQVVAGTIVTAAA